MREQGSWDRSSSISNTIAVIGHVGPPTPKKYLGLMDVGSRRLHISFFSQTYSHPLRPVVRYARFPRSELLVRIIACCVTQSGTTANLIATSSLLSIADCATRIFSLQHSTLDRNHPGLKEQPASCLTNSPGMFTSRRLSIFTGRGIPDRREYTLACR